jgi:type IV pilus assembly protein PilE
MQNAYCKRTAWPFVPSESPPVGKRWRTGGIQPIFYAEETEVKAQNKGVTIVELLIVMVIIGILTAIAFPAYDSYLRKGRRADAQALMMDIATKEQQYLLDARQYTATIGAGGLNISTSGWTCAATCTNGFYTITVAPASPPPSFTITAAVQGPQVGDGNLTLDHQGNRTRDGKPGW